MVKVRHSPHTSVIDVCSSITLVHQLPWCNQAIINSRWKTIKTYYWLFFFGKAMRLFPAIIRSVRQHSCITHTGSLVVAGRGIWTFVVSMACLSDGLLCGWSLWKGLVPGWTRLRAPPSRMYTCSGATSSQRGPWKPERHTQVCGRLQEPRFWQGGWQSAEERAQMEIKFSAGHVRACAPLVWRSSSRKTFPDLNTGAHFKLIQSRGH